MLLALVLTLLVLVLSCGALLIVDVVGVVGIGVIAWPC